MHVLRYVCPLGLALFCVIPTTTRAASFDCARAATAHERHICDTPTLNAADTAMGNAYRVAAAAFPVKDAVVTMQRYFLAYYGMCDKPDHQTCETALVDQTARLRSMVNATVYTDTAKGALFVPDSALLWTSLGSNQATLHYFGVYMPDMNRPIPFPRGFVCDGAVTLTKTATGYEYHADGNDIILTEDSVISKLSCSPRNGIFGTFKRLR